MLTLLTQVESLKEALKDVNFATHLQWAAVAGLMLLTFYHLCRTGVEGRIFTL